MKRPTLSSLFCPALSGAAVGIHAEDQTQPNFQVMIAGLFFDEQSYMAESSVWLPLIREASFGLTLPPA